MDEGNKAYFKARIRHQAFNVLVGAVKQSPLSADEIAKRVGIDAKYMSRLLRYPRDISLALLAEIVFVASGNAVRMELQEPRALTSPSPVAPSQ